MRVPPLSPCSLLSPLVSFSLLSLSASLCPLSLSLPLLLSCLSLSLLPGEKREGEGDGELGWMFALVLVLLAVIVGADDASNSMAGQTLIITTTEVSTPLPLAPF